MVRTEAPPGSHRRGFFFRAEGTSQHSCDGIPRDKKTVPDRAYRKPSDPAMSAPTVTRTAPKLLLEFAGQYPAPLPRDLQHENTALLGQYLNSWTRHFGELNHRSDGDFEHFVETMARFDAAWRAFGTENTTVRNLIRPDVESLCDFHGAPLLSAGDPDFVFGPIASWGSGHGNTRGEGVADDYWNIPAFEALSGRRWQLAGFLPDDQNEPDLLAVLQGMFDDGVHDFVVKGTQPKTLLVKFSLTVRPTDLIGRGTEIPSEITDSALHLEGRSNVFLVQEAIPMIHEYRFFMAGPRPVSGAGCIEKFTPLDSTGSSFDGRTEGRRGSGAVSDTWDEVVKPMLHFAADAGALLHEQAPELGPAWVMDLAVNAETGQIVVIELNPARNAGLYASSPSAWMGGVRDYLAAG